MRTFQRPKRLASLLLILGCLGLWLVPISPTVGDPLRPIEGAMPVFVSGSSKPGPRPGPVASANRGTSNGASSLGRTPGGFWTGRLVARSKGWPVFGATLQARSGERVFSACVSDAQGRFALPRHAASSSEWELVVTGPHVAHTATFSNRVLLEDSQWPLQVPALVRISGSIQADWLVDLWRGHFLILCEAEGQPAQELASGDLNEDGSWQACIPLAQASKGLRVLVGHPDAVLEQREVLITQLDQFAGHWTMRAGLTLQGQVHSPYPKAIRSRFVQVQRVSSGVQDLDMPYAVWGLARNCGELCMRSRVVPIDEHGGFRVSGLTPGQHEVRLLSPGEGAGSHAEGTRPENITHLDIQDDAAFVSLQEW